MYAYIVNAYVPATVDGSIDPYTSFTTHLHLLAVLYLFLLDIGFGINK